MRHKYLALAVSLALAAPLTVNAELLQIDDSTDVLKLYVGGTLYDPAGSSPDPRISNYSVAYSGAAVEKMTFSFTSTNPWVKNFKLYTIMGGESEDLNAGMFVSDVFFWNGALGGNVANVTFYSADFASYADMQAWLAGLSSSDPLYFDTTGYEKAYQVTEKDAFLTVAQAFDTGTGAVIDTYQVRSDAPEPASLALLGLGFAGLVASRRRLPV